MSDVTVKAPFPKPTFNDTYLRVKDNPTRDNEISRELATKFVEAGGGKIEKKFGAPFYTDSKAKTETVVRNFLQAVANLFLKLLNTLGIRHLHRVTVVKRSDFDAYNSKVSEALTRFSERAEARKERIEANVRKAADKFIELGEARAERKEAEAQEAADSRNAKIALTVAGIATAAAAYVVGTNLVSSLNSAETIDLPVLPRRGTLPVLDLPSAPLTENLEPAVVYGPENFIGPRVPEFKLTTEQLYDLAFNKELVEAIKA